MRSRAPAVSPVKLFFKVILVVFLAEAGVMIVLSRFPPMSHALEAVVDASALSILLSPCLWWWLVVESRRRQTVERELEFQRHALDLHALVSETDAAGRITYASDLFCEVSGYSREELLGCKHSIVSSGLHAGEFWKDMYAELARTGVWHGEICNRAKGGHLYWVSSTIVAFRDGSGKITRYVGIRTEITKRKLVEQELERSRAHAEAANRAKGEFLAVMSHEIRTPMNAVLGFTDLLTETPLTDIQKDFVRTIRQSGASLLTLINDILDYSKIEAGKLNLELMPFDLRESCEAVLGLLVSKAYSKGLEMSLVAHPAPLALVSDPTRVRQILTNLVGNAIKFTSAGYVRVEIRVLPGVGQPTAGGRVQVRVSDSGIGIPVTKQHLLFQKFTQTDTSTTRKYGGTGLGLAISKQLVEIMGGTIGVESEVGKGACFWFDFALPDSPIDLPEAAFPPSLHLPNGVLSISASAPHQEAVESMLAGWGVQCVAAQSSAEALERWREAERDGRPFDVVLLQVVTLGSEANRGVESLRSELNVAPGRIVLCQPAGQQLDGYLNLRTPLLRPETLAEALARASQSGSDTRAAA
jgi:two-component system sensor histidine kinase/response regulator